MQENTDRGTVTAPPGGDTVVDQGTGHFDPGAIVLRREILDGRTWLSYPVRVVADRTDLLAVYLARGTELTFGDGDFSWGPHPWQQISGRWRSQGVLQLQRPGDAYAVWMFRDDTTGDFTGWYVNFQDPYRKNASGFDTLDHELDLWIPADGGPYRWKDVDEFEHRAHSGGFTTEQAAAVRAEGARVADLLDRRATWWEQEWAQWEPATGWLAPPAWTGAVR